MSVRLNDEELKKLQKIELEMLIEIDRICRKYKIKYSLGGGTLLGAIRHNGFIPWDDDADVTMIRTEYKKFRRACKKELDKSRFFLQDWTTDPGYRWGYAKMRRNDTLFIGENQERLNQHQGVFLDIFIYDNVPDGFIARRVHYFLAFLIRKIQYSEVAKYKEKNPFYRTLYKLINHIPVKYTFKWLDALGRITNRHKTKLIRHMTFTYDGSNKFGMPRRCFDSYIDKDFEGHMFRIYKEYDYYLKWAYGDYMKLPPEDKRIPYPVSEFKLIDVDV